MYQFVFLYFRTILVMMESAVSGHPMLRIRDRLADKCEIVAFDPFSKKIECKFQATQLLTNKNPFVSVQKMCIYREKKKVKSFK